MLVQISEIVVNQRRLETKPDTVRELADSIAKLGLLNPITIDGKHILIAGLHRLEAAKMLHWTEIECTVSSLEGLMAEMAELDENFVRANLSVIDRGNLLLRRKEIYEMLHPQSRHGGDRKSEKIKSAKCTLDNERSFVDDTADKLDVDPSTVRRQLQTAKNLTSEAKAIIKDSDTKITKKDALKLSRLEPEQQKEAASQLAAGEIRSMNEYQSSAMEQENQQAQAVMEPEPETAALSAAPSTPNEESRSSLKQIIADLKNHDKDCSYTPDALLEEIDSFADRFHRDFAWYSEPHYTAVFPQMSEKQLEFVKQRFASISAEMEDLLHRMERMMKHE